MSITFGQILASGPLAGARKEVLVDAGDPAVQEVRHGAEDAVRGALVVVDSDDGDLAAVLARAPASVLIAADTAAWRPSTQLARDAERQRIGVVIMGGHDSATVHSWAQVALAQAEAARSSGLERFTSRLLDELRGGHGLSGLMDAASVVLDAPVVLATVERRIVAVAGLPPQADSSSVLAEAATRVSLPVAGQPWGGLSTTAAGLVGGAPADELLRRLAAVAELELLRSSEALAPERRARRELLRDLLSGRGAGLAQRAEVLGVRIADGDALIALAATRAAVGRDGVEQALRRHGLSGLWSTLDEDVLLLAVAPARPDASAAAQQVAASIARAATSSGAGSIVAVGPLATDISEAGRALREARRTLGIARSAGDSRPIVTSEMLLVDRVLARLAQDPEVIRTVEEVLEPVRLLPAPRRRTLMHTLRTYLDSGGSKTGTAHRLHIRRQSLYTRLEHLDDLVGPLADPERRLALQLAIRTARLRGDDDLVGPPGRR